MWGIMLAIRKANATQAKRNPPPADTFMPRGTWVGWTFHDSTSPAFLMRVDQMDEPARTAMVATTGAKLKIGSGQEHRKPPAMSPLGGTRRVRQDQ